MGRAIKFCALSKHGNLVYAHQLFDKMPHPDAFIYNTLIKGYLQCHLARDCLFLYLRMLQDYVIPNSFTFPSLVRACCIDGWVEEGRQIHAHVIKFGFLDDGFSQNNLIYMYLSFGSLQEARKVFDNMPQRGISTWNSMIGGLAMHGQGEAAIEVFKEMEKKTVPPDNITFMNVLSACAHSGLVETGRYYFKHMTEFHGLEPRMEHFGCIVDLLGRAGLLEEARKLVEEEMPMQADASVLGALVGACKIHQNIKLGEKFGKRLIELDPNNSGRYVLLANLYATAGKWDDVVNIRRLMNDRGVKKIPGFSVIEMEGIVSEFVAGESDHPQSKEIYAKLDGMLERISCLGYLPDTDVVLQSMDDEEEMENSLKYHSEKLAIAFGLLKTKPGQTIRITKNLRVCRDCHEASKLVSKAFDRKIIVRDRNRFHHFRNGECSCKDFW
ncbi:hypothetical protein RDABS01_024175 [Bienertia sinuspersici]